MRQGQQNRRGRGRSNNSSGGSNNINNSHSNHSSNNNNNSNNGRKPQNPLSRNYESSGPDVKIRGTAAHIAEKYITLARDAASSGDIVMAENYLQHAEHYNRIIAAAQAQTPAPQPYQGSDNIPGMNGNGQYRPQPDDNQLAMRDEPQPVIAEQPAPLPGLEPQPVISEEGIANGADVMDSNPGAPRDIDGRRRRRRYPAAGPVARPNGAPEPGNLQNGAANGANSLDGAGENQSPDEIVAN